MILWSLISLISTLILAIIADIFVKSLYSPPNAIWAIFSGYYSYDPRTQNPPKDLFLERPEDSLKYFFDSTLKLCGGKYPPLSNIPVERYEVEQVEYLGHNDYHAFSLLHTRVYFTNGKSVRAVFQFEAGHNESYPLYVVDMASIRTGSWMSVGSFMRDPDTPPPGWSQYQENERPFICTPGPPYAIEDP